MLIFFCAKLLPVIILSPVDCIHWTSAAQLSLLENEMRRVERVNVSKLSVRWNFEICVIDVTFFFHGC